MFACKVQRSYGTDASNDDPHWVSALTTLHNTDTVITGSRDGWLRVWQVGEGFIFGAGADLFISDRCDAAAAGESYSNLTGECSQSGLSTE